MARLKYITLSHQLSGVTADGILERYAKRAVTVHLKEFSSTSKKVVIGEGEMEWKKIFSLCEMIGAQNGILLNKKPMPIHNSNVQSAA